MTTERTEEGAEITLLTGRELCTLFGVSRSTLYRYVEQGLLPPPLKLGPRCSRWQKHEMLEALRGRVRMRDTAVSRKAAKTYR